MDFSLRTCSWRGHATYAPDETELARRLHVSTPAGTAWRCLRCGDFVVGEPRGRGPADEAPEVPRGRLLRDRFILRLLAVERIFRGVLFVALAAGVFQVRRSQTKLHESFDKEMPLIRPITDQLGWNPDNSKIVHFIEEGWKLSPTVLTLIAAGLLAYAIIEFIEAIGLWLAQRWGEYFAVIATAIFLPLEIYELTEKITVLRAGMLAINIVAVLWLLWSKRLFGLNGGGRAYHAEHNEESLLTVERSAVAVGTGAAEGGPDEPTVRMSHAPQRSGR
ncbi:DUF2127 domain-containing protein [Nocardia sp. NEAU-G5]|uniref:DUF2127 domain-containing protein n=1 Tax=Nocardia albiluteola TaxID=2842303 RepID=A0ABS6AVF4_9NOCA|nr:DUF2127 domain-containing protein [Nocardia albiluteola]MBU3062013.1 DUF2127 domain-containing protein [Nocardia albiluteola]